MQSGANAQKKKKTPAVTCKRLFLRFVYQNAVALDLRGGVTLPPGIAQFSALREKSKRRATDASMVAPITLTDPDRLPHRASRSYFSLELWGENNASPKALHADHSFHDGICQ